MATPKYNGPMKGQHGHHSTPELNDGPCLLEPGESLPLKFQIDRMMDAGVQRQVAAAMTRLYHFGPDGSIPEDFLDPMQDFNINIARVHELKHYLEAKIRRDEEAAAAAIAKAKEENEKDALPDEPKGPSDDDQPTDEPTTP
jgi:hypothetical protein